MDRARYIPAKQVVRQGLLRVCGEDQPAQKIQYMQEFVHDIIILQCPLSS